MRSLWLMNVAGGAMVAVLAAQSGGPRPSTAGSAANDWPMYRHDQAGTGYSPLTQIDARNVASLTQAWTYRLQSDAPRRRPPAAEAVRPRVNSQATPIVVNGVMYLPAANRVVALDPETGKEIWQHSVTGGAPSRRGVAYWPGDGTLPPRIIFTAGRRLIALNAEDRRARCRLRHRRRSGHGRAVQLGAARSTRTSSSSARTRRRGRPAGSATRGRSMRAPAPSCGSSARWRSRARSVTTPGKATAGRAASAPTPGRSTSRSTSGAGCSTCRWRRRSPAPTAATARAPTCSATRSSPWTSRPASTSGTSRPSITISGTPIRPRRPGCSTSCGTAAPIPALALTTKSGYLYILNRETGQPIFGVEERPVAEERCARRGWPFRRSRFR